MKNQSILLTGVISLLLGLSLGYALWGGHYGAYQSHDDMTNESKRGDMHHMGDEDNDTDMGMMGSMDHGMMMVQSEQEFLEGMIPHHQEAVDTAKAVLERGGSTPEIKKLAQDIVTAQEKEITLMKAWYQNWYNKPYKENAGDYQAMMRDLGSLSGAALDRVFLEDMIMHHMGAIMMAQSVRPYIEHKEITDLTQAIVATQTVEIELMRRLLSGL